MTLEIWFHDQRKPAVKWGRFSFDGERVEVSELSPEYKPAVERGVYSRELKRSVIPADGRPFIDALKLAYRQSSTMQVRVIHS